MALRTHLPENEYVQKLGLVAYLVSSVEGLLLFDIPRLEHVLPVELNTTAMAGLTTRQIGEFLATHAVHSADDKVAAYFEAGGRALIEIAPQRNAMLHSRPATDPEGRTRLYRWRLRGAQSEVFWIDDDWLDSLIQRIDELKVELNALRPSLDVD